ncbi:MAG: hypothetical protein F4X56_02145 [Gammaproteobacteria bacterium]|nr:hypothetical protein [Gammaproteobacteria bacterium]
MKKYTSTIIAVCVLTCTIQLITQETTDTEEAASDSSNDKVMKETILENFVGPMKKYLRRLGVSEDTIESLDNLQYQSLDAEDLRIEEGIQMLEELIPKLQGLSSTWKSLEPMTVFSLLIISIAEYHKLPDEKLQELTTAINQYIDVASQHEHKLVNIITNHYFRTLVGYYKRMREDLTPWESDKEELLQIRVKLLLENSNADTRKIDKFVSCVAETHRKVDKGFNKLFSSLTNALEKSVSAIPKLERIDDERSKKFKISNKINNAIVPRPVSKIGSIVSKMTARNCHGVVDVESIKLDY